MVKIKLINMQFFGYHGVNEEEEKLGQAFQTDVIIYLPESIKEDNLEHTVNYSGIFKIVKSEVESERYNLIEILAQKITEKIYNTYSKQITRIILRIRKPSVALKGILDYAEVEIDKSYE